ncbi:MAG: DUF108 domain-containing protein [Candidatus Omnitrophica bacterium]|nr:DUF108 domain-containing protein [Candidatus Omnitrophota bacterium]
MKKLAVGLVGCGAIGTYLAKRIDRELSKEIALTAICDINPLSANRLRDSLRQKPTICNISHLIKKSDLVIEAASVKSCLLLLDDVISSGKDILVMSAGALLLKKNIAKLAKRKGARIYIPSGAIAGVDAIRAAGFGKINKIQLTTRKPARTLLDVPYLKKKRLDMAKLKGEVELFSGNASSAISNFPKNINVAAIISLSSLGPKKTKVKILASSRISRNIHEIEVNADCGRIFTRVENRPSRDNPKTSYLAMLSAFATIKNILSPLKIGG